MTPRHAIVARRTVRAAVVLAMATLAGCASAPRVAPQRSPIAHWTPSPNYNARKAQIIVLHHTSIGNATEALRVLSTRNSEGQVSAHYLVESDGRIDQLVDDGDRAWHAGASRWGDMTDLNSSSIGIEIDNDGESPFTDAQIQALIRLLADLTSRLGIPRQAVVGHGDIAPGRKTDPSAQFPWATLARYGFGLWPDAVLVPAPPGFDSLAALRLVGYDVSTPRTAIAAFHRHYRAMETDTLDATDAAILYSLQRKLMAPRQ
ncbi:MULTISPECIES: N-acetylmuramoyl-L-alanine amidase [unclassified Luteibacter]|uniref:N-acetylmuramoyl-L-alanine amidase n=1 Tax=unclassified Luteibacter TaxID=2620188 RepID=UPI0008C38BC3|nr:MULTISPECIES: N-acetylmuramoyl-L-alanine amidase [unclassified Luteibacter]SEO41325.1 N-acetylmuramoyl-L-alanine amidase [Luteibacter sp. UNC138MFCol5.1]SEW26932.1 N-acetylmuramoyl-L-alanine amidase [Luteibacter sp. 329MFSha]